jgi:hypothetical protein
MTEPFPNGRGICCCCRKFVPNLANHKTKSTRISFSRGVRGVLMAKEQDCAFSGEFGCRFEKRNGHRLEGSGLLMIVSEREWRVS